MLSDIKYGLLSHFLARGPLATEVRPSTLVSLVDFHYAVIVNDRGRLGVRLVGGGVGLAVIADELEAADHLANGEEAQALSEEDTSSGDLCPGDVADVLEGSASLGEERAGLDGLHEVLEVGLEGRDGAIR